MKIISIASTKGGSGKSTLTTILASALHHREGINTGIIDADYPQHSIFNFRQDDFERIKKDEVEKKRLKALGKKPYPITSCKLEDLKATVGQIDPGTVDILFVDMTGSINQKGVVEALASFDHIFIPLEADQFSFDATTSFALTLRDKFLGIPSTSLQSFHVFWNRVVKSEKNKLYERIEEVYRKEGIPVMESRLYASVSFKKPEMRSTFFPYENKYEFTGVSNFISNFNKIVF